MRPCRLTSPLGAIIAAGLALLVVGPAPAHAALTWSGPRVLDHAGGAPLPGVSCPSTTSCVAVDKLGRVVSFNPASPTPTTPVTVSPSDDFSAVACASTTQC